MHKPEGLLKVYPANPEVIPFSPRLELESVRPCVRASHSLQQPISFTFMQRGFFTPAEEARSLKADEIIPTSCFYFLINIFVWIRA